MSTVSYTDFEKLASRVAELENELKKYKSLEWDRLYIKDMLRYVKITTHDELPNAKIEPPNQADEAFKREYYRRVAELEAARDITSSTSE